MSKILVCNWVHPAGCDHEMRGESVAEVLELARAHALEHGIEPTPEILRAVESLVEDE